MPRTRTSAGVATALALAVSLAACSAPRQIPAGPLQAGPPLVLLPATVAGITDQRARFREIFCKVLETRVAAGQLDLRASQQPSPVADCDRYLQRLDGETVGRGEAVHLERSKLGLRVLLVPGFGSDCFADLAPVLADAEKALNALDYPTSSVPVLGLGSSTANAVLVRDAVMATPRPEGTGNANVVLIGYSKGAPDILEALATYPELLPRVAAVVSLAGSVGGSALADGANESFAKLLDVFPGTQCQDSDHGAVESLQRPHRQRRLAEHPLPSSLPTFSVGAFTTRDRVARTLRPFYDRLARIDPRNDGQLVFHDQVLPGSALLGYAAADHWSIALSIARDRPALAGLLDVEDFPRAALVEAIVRHVEEQLLAKKGPAAKRRGTTSN